jgi:hypothetical protein
VDADELRAAREHLAGCDQPHSELRSLLGAEAAVAAGLEPIQPSADLRDRLMGTAAETPQDRAVTAAPAAEPVAEEQPERVRRGWLDWLSPNVARPLAVAAVVALVALGIWGYSISSQLNEQRDALRAVADAIAAGEPGAPGRGQRRTRLRGRHGGRGIVLRGHRRHDAGREPAVRAVADRAGRHTGGRRRLRARRPAVALVAVDRICPGSRPSP